eukprot:jgi/Ulvmu1/12453/UM009_0105.1
MACCLRPQKWAAVDEPESDGSARHKRASRHAQATPESSHVALYCYLLPSPGSTTLTPTLSSYSVSNPSAGAAAAKLHPPPSSALQQSALGTATTPGAATPLMCAILAPRPPASDAVARLKTLQACLRTGKSPELWHSAAVVSIADDACDRIMPSSMGDRNSSLPAAAALPPAPTSSPTLYGPPLIAAALGACSHAAEFTPLIGALLDCGADPRAVLSRSAGAEAGGTGAGSPVATSGPLAGDTAWLQGASALHLLMLFGLHQQEAVLPVVRQLIAGGVSAEAQMHGATPLHILCARAPQLRPPAAADLVAALATRHTVSRPAAPAMTPAAAALKRALPLHEAAPLELAAVATGDDPALLEALLAKGADVEGEAGARAVMITLLHGKLARARVLIQRQACLVAEVPLRWPPIPQPQAQPCAGGSPPLAPLLTRSAADVFRKAADMLHAAAPPLANGYTNGSPVRNGTPNGATNGTKADHGPGGAAERKVVWLSPLQWVVAAGAAAVPSDIGDVQLRKLLHEVLAAVPRIAGPGKAGLNKAGLGVMPKLPLWNSRGAPHACSLELYIIRNCPLPYTVLSLAAGVDLNNAFEDVEVLPGKLTSAPVRVGSAAGTLRIERNAVVALLQRGAVHDDTKANLVAAANLLIDSGASPSRVDGETGNNALHDLPRGFTSLYPAIRDAGADIAALNRSGFSPMHCAAARADVPLARLLLRDGADAGGGDGGGPMRAAASPRHASTPSVAAAAAGHSVPAMSARNVALVQSLAASGAAASGDDRRGGLPGAAGMPDVVEEMQGLLAQLGAPPLQQRSLTPPRRTGAKGGAAQTPPKPPSAGGTVAATPPTTAGSGVSTGSAASRGSAGRGRTTASAFHTHSSAATTTSVPGTSVSSSKVAGQGAGRRGARAVAGALQGQDRASSGTPPAANGLTDRGATSGAELRSSMSGESLERVDSGGGRMKLLGAAHLSDSPGGAPIATIPASALPSPARYVNGSPERKRIGRGGSLPRRSVSPSKRVAGSIPARRVSAGVGQGLGDGPPLEVHTPMALPRRRAVSSNGERPPGTGGELGAGTPAVRAATTGLRQPGQCPSTAGVARSRSYLSETASSARKRNLSRSASDLTVLAPTLNGSAPPYTPLSPSIGAERMYMPASPAGARSGIPSRAQHGPQYSSSGHAARPLAGPPPSPSAIPPARTSVDSPSLRTPRGAQRAGAPAVEVSPTTQAAGLPASHAEASPAKPVPRIALHSMRAASTSPPVAPRHAGGQHVVHDGSVSPASLPAVHGGSAAIGCGYGVAELDADGSGGRLRGLAEETSDAATPPGSPRAARAAFGGRRRDDYSRDGRHAERGSTRGGTPSLRPPWRHSTDDSVAPRRGTTDSVMTGRTSSVATEMRSFMSASTDSTWAHRPSHGTTGRGDPRSPSVSPIGHAVTMPGSQFAQQAGDSAAGADAASPGASADRGGGPRRGRYGRRAVRVQAGRDALEQGQVIIRRITEAGGLFQLQQEIGADELVELVSQPLARGRTVLHCLRDTQEHLVRPFVNLGGFGINSPDADGNTPLHIAAGDGQAAVLRMLVMCSADPSIRNRAGRDALICAVRSKANTMSIVKTLMKLGVNPDAQDSSGRTALDIAKARASGGQDQLVAFMTRTARVHAMQQHRRQKRRQNNR